MTSHGRENVLAYSGGVLDRAANQRSDPGWIDATLAEASTRLIPMWRDQCVVSGEPAVPAILPAAGVSVTAGPADPRLAAITAGTSGRAGTRRAHGCISRGSSPR